MIDFNQNALCGTYQGRLLICGGGWNLYQDLAKTDLKRFDVMCVNDIYMHFPGEVIHHYSNDNDWLPRWHAARRPLYLEKYPAKTLMHCCNPCEKAVVWDLPGHGTSALNAVYVGLALGYDDILLAGVPLDNNGHYFDPRPGEMGGQYSHFEQEVPERNGELKYWSNANRLYFENRVKAISGRLTAILGT